MKPWFASTTQAAIVKMLHEEFLFDQIKHLGNVGDIARFAAEWEPGQVVWIEVRADLDFDVIPQPPAPPARLPFKPRAAARLTGGRR